jgi:hypothetical protein
MALLTFDPAEKKDDPEGDRYREVTLPAGSENWFAPDFDPAKAGWKSAKAPFGQKNGAQEALIPSCKVSYCGCHITPATLWDKEVLLMRQTFEVPKLDPNHRYRIVVGGAGHPWSGEGFALYLNGKLVSEATGGYYKSGGDARGVIVFNELLPEFERHRHHRREELPAPQRPPPPGHGALLAQRLECDSICLRWSPSRWWPGAAGTAGRCCARSARAAGAAPAHRDPLAAQGGGRLPALDPRAGRRGAVMAIFFYTAGVLATRCSAEPTPTGSAHSAKVSTRCSRS